MMPLHIARRLLTRILVTVGLVTVLVMTTPLVSWWALAYAGPLNQPKGDILIMLSAAPDDKGGISFSSYWRARHALLAWQTGGFKKIVVTGGGGPSIVNFLIVEGIPSEDIVAEWKSTTTRENALAVARMTQDMPGKKVLLTSDFHMYRAERVFRKAGVDVTPLPVPDALRLAEHWYGRFPVFQTMLIESAKIVYYRLHGWM
jgi:uncharacterized SAM-binding protein YcdF (DUF218 family)